MNRTAKIVLFYCGVALVAVAIISTAMWARNTMPSHGHEGQFAIDIGRAEVTELRSIDKDLIATNQDQQAVKLSDLRGKVWVAAEFYAVCPFCAVRNGKELREIYDEFKGNPDFNITCISVDPEMDTPDKMRNYAKALSADSKNWWFLNGGDTKTVHDFLEHNMGFFRIGQRTDPLEIEAKGRYEHDLSFMLVSRDFKVLGKWPLADLRSDEAMQRDPEGYKKAKKEMYDRIRLELGKNETSVAK